MHVIDPTIKKLKFLSWSDFYLTLEGNEDVLWTVRKTVTPNLVNSNQFIVEVRSSLLSIINKWVLSKKNGSGSSVLSRRQSQVGWDQDDVHLTEGLSQNMMTCPFGLR